MVRRGRDRLDESFVLTTKDNVNLRIKPLMITKTNTKSSALKLVRKACQQALSAYFKKTDAETVFKDAIQFKLHMGIKEQVSKIYPLRNFEIKYLGVEQKKKEEKAQEAPIEQ